MIVTLKLPKGLAASLALLSEQNQTSPERELIVAFAEKIARLEHTEWLRERTNERQSAKN